MYKKHKQYRLYNFDYSQDGHYFITIVTKDREHLFGKIVNKEMIYSPTREYVKNNILKFYVDESLENPYQNNPYIINSNPTIIGITEWSVLPNHIHVIIEGLKNLKACNHPEDHGFYSRDKKWLKLPTF